LEDFPNPDGLHTNGPCLVTTLIKRFERARNIPHKTLNPGVGGIGVFLRSHKQKILGSHPVAAYPERRALRTQLSCVYVNSSGGLSQMIGKP
jgi:hypothetical protein